MKRIWAAAFTTRPMAILKRKLHDKEFREHFSGT